MGTGSGVGGLVVGCSDGDGEGSRNIPSLILFEEPNTAVSVPRSSTSLPPNSMTSAAMDNISIGVANISIFFHFGSI